MIYSTATVIETREDCFPMRRLVKCNGRYYTTFGRLFAAAGKHMYCDAAGYRALVHGTTYAFTDWDNLRGIYREEN